MKHIRKYALPFLAFSLLALVAVACKEEKKEPTTSTSSATASTAPAAATQEVDAIPDPEGEVIGEVSGVVDGEAFANYVLISDLDAFDEPLASASWTQNITGYTVDILSYRYSQMSRNGGMNLHIKLDNDLEFIDEDSFGTYLESMTSLFNLPRGGSIENITATLDDDGLMTISGTFSGKAEESVLWDDGEELEFVTLEDGKFSVSKIAEYVW